MLEVILMAVAIVGGSLYFFGRWLMLHDSSSELGTVWTIALRYIPLAELIYLVRFYNQAKRGGFMCIAGLWLMVPWFGNRLWEEQKAYTQGGGPGFVQEAYSSNENMDEAESGDDDRLFSDTYYDQDRITQKQQKVTLLQSRLAAWYQQIQQRRTVLGTDPASIQAFNDEAAAYGALNTIAKQESAELAAWQSGK